jgi:hypothetical protein
MEHREKTHQFPVQNELDQIEVLKKLGFDVEINPEGSPDIFVASLADKKDKLRVVVANDDPFSLALDIIKSYQVHAKFFYKRTLAYEKLIEMIKDEVEIPKVIIENPEFILGQKPTEYDIKWAKEVLKNLNKRTK